MANENQAEGAWDKTKGAVKEGIGHLTGDEKTQAEGTTDKAKGSLKEGAGDVQEGLHNAKDAMQDKTGTGGGTETKPA